MTDTAADPSARQNASTQPEDGMPLAGIDHLELYVGNAALAAHYFTSALGFGLSAYAGLETGVRDRASYVLESGEARLVLTAPVRDGPIARHVALHGDGVRAVALTVPDAVQAFEHAVAQGAHPIAEPSVAKDEEGEVRQARIAAYGDTVHTFVERDAYRGPFLPGYERPPGAKAASDTLFTGVDHVVGNIERGSLGEWVAFYEHVFGFTELIGFTDRDVSTEYSALMSKVMADGAARVKLPLNEPAEGRRRSQVQEFLDFYGGPGVQHVALETNDIVTAVELLRGRGVRFLATPPSYYSDLSDRVPDLRHEVSVLRDVGILADSDDEGHLLQIFTRPLGDRPTLFLELIERHGSRGFGEGNFKALFESIEREQALRGNL
jgi:4-hydroxyphenylpyruvate dioxygenase